MIKKTLLTIYISTVSASLYAYNIVNNFTVTNNTNLAISVEITQPHSQGKTILKLPAHTSSKVYLSNGDSSGELYATSSAPFVIKANGQTYAYGRIAYYVGASMWNEYSFLDTLTAADGLNLDPHYTCQKRMPGEVFENTLAINGTPLHAITVKAFPEKISCDGYKSSSLDDLSLDYTPTCFDDSSRTFWQKMDYNCYYNCKGFYLYTDYINNYKIQYSNNHAALQDSLNKKVGYAFCQSWQR